MDNSTRKLDEQYMRIALSEASKALNWGDVPIGAVIVKDNRIISKAYNQVERKLSPLSHAELLAINKAIKKTGYKYLLDCTLYVTLEPCPMCAGAIVLSRIPRLVYSADDPKAGACSSLFSITSDKRLNHRCEVVYGVLKDESSRLLKTFFKGLREHKKNGY
jgi:tRNA(adenine34) deaminase